jgi:nicotinamidase-related amidase
MKPALLVVDIQNWFFRTEERQKGIPQVVNGTNELIEYFDSKNLPVIHVLTVHKADKSTWPITMLQGNHSVLIEGTHEPEELEQIKKSTKHQTLIKTRHSAFLRTNLEEQLKSQGIDTVIITGVFLHGCVSMTAIDSYERDFNAIIAKDATFSHKPDLANAYLQSVKDEYNGKYLTNSEIISSLDSTQ